ncbi:hypothetical protein Clacol_006961 [Clathrus columnatus]|uniref:Uncharacterized protein n=1 Tax=Clathrus columnatus TaxID=1419009 RepID=A0AAV5AGH0_9AGAM|nr:hypothetical protein Clacol_006961 [Clathrus columnatus]
MSEGFTKAIIRGYEEACDIGGQVDPNFVPSYNNAQAVGITKIDTYWFPCTGSGNPCKSFATQLAEIGNTFVANNMNIVELWSRRKPQELISAARASGFNFGIYSSPGEWSNIFGSLSAVLDNSVPLWFATYDNVETTTLSTPFGGQVFRFEKVVY